MKVATHSAVHNHILFLAETAARLNDVSQPTMPTQAHFQSYNYSNAISVSHHHGDQNCYLFKPASGIIRSTEQIKPGLKRNVFEFDLFFNPILSLPFKTCYICLVCGGGTRGSVKTGGILFL
jgi:hypothetical protein